jgi:hypothetical protein
MGGWTCDALRVPDAKVTTLYHGGRQADARDYTQKDTTILWTSGIARPDAVDVTIHLNSDLKKASDLDELEKQKLKLEGEKLGLERDIATAKDKLERDLANQKTELEDKRIAEETRWKRYAAIASILAAGLSAATTYAISKPKMPESCKESLVKLRAAAESSVPEQTLEKLRSAIERHALTCEKSN